MTAMANIGNIKACAFALCLLAGATICCKPPAAMAAPPANFDPHLKIWDDLPAPKWDLAYPVGNGRLGAMSLGRFPQDKILINEETIWARGPDEKFTMPKNSPQLLEEIRRLEAAGDYRGADKIVEEQLQRDARPDSYQFLGWLHLDYQDTAPLKATHRELDLATGVALSIFELEDETTITQKVFVSAPDDVIAIRVGASKPVGLQVSFAEDGKVENGDLVKGGKATGDNATRYIGRVRALADGEVASDGPALTITNSKNITIYLAAATDFNRTRRTKLPGGWQEQALQTLDAVGRKSPHAVETASVSDHRNYFDRVDIDLGSTPAPLLTLPMRKRLALVKEGGTDPELVETYFQLGRYLLIGSSRAGCLPANLQGIWNPHEKAPWGSDYHLDINLQMNYFHAETANLSELHGPVFDLIDYFRRYGRKMARSIGMDGWCMGHATDAWGHARIMSKTAYWGGSFLCGHWQLFDIMEHYRFNRDKQFLEDNWGILTDSVRFLVSWLIPGPGEGELMARPAMSPENRFLYENDEGAEVAAAFSAGNSFDQWVILQIFNDYLEAARALGKEDDKLVKRVEGLLPKIYRPRIGDDGRLMEWRLPFKEHNPGHRHMSHLIAAYPCALLDLDNDPAMHAAVKKSLETRLESGGGWTGWSRAWAIGLFARLDDDAGAYANLMAILRESTLDNLFDVCPPFEIDGNFGAPAAIVEMLLQSHDGKIELLPALPAEWPDGHVRGLRARGDYTVDIEWKAVRLASATITAGERAPSGAVEVAYNDKRTSVDLAPGQTAKLTMQDFDQ